MLKSARQSDSGGWTGEEDQTSSSIMDMAEQHLGELLERRVVSDWHAWW